jgi:hypothetical protein
MVDALFIDLDGPYPALVGREHCWGETRDALTYTGAGPVVCHPPCQRWGSYAFLNFSRWGGEHNLPGNDGGTFKFALDSVRKCDGVLEHPAFTRAWEAFGLKRPIGIGWVQASPYSWVCEVWQSAYGHKARKRTWLYYYSSDKHPPYDALWGRLDGTHQIGQHDQRGKIRNKPTLGRKDSIHTPRKFAEYLVCLAHRAKYGR